MSWAPPPWCHDLPGQAGWLDCPVTTSAMVSLSQPEDMFETLTWLQGGSGTGVFTAGPENKASVPRLLLLLFLGDKCHYGDQIGLKLLVTLLPQLPHRWDYRCTPLHLAQSPLLASHTLLGSAEVAWGEGTAPPVPILVSTRCLHPLAGSGPAWRIPCLIPNPCSRWDTEERRLAGQVSPSPQAHPVRVTHWTWHLPTPLSWLPSPSDWLVLFRDPAGRPLCRPSQHGPAPDTAPFLFRVNGTLAACHQDQEDSSLLNKL